ncbi:hypothetical protein [Aquabacter cavernae]|uniref:hypothetical protein n=1 Tax=Aquabacter cavernae TaxID=2496029 RepID=UPI000F8C6F05|nr:hypothetical protein [Aquabacter cavernae]
MFVRLTTAAALCLTATVALADRPAADKCAAGLNADGQSIYAASAAQVTPGADVRAVVKSATETLVRSGSVSMGNARPAAEAAGKCLVLINS